VLGERERLHGEEGVESNAVRATNVTNVMCEQREANPNMSWSELKTRKMQLASAYCWLGNLAGALWKHYCDHELDHGRRTRGLEAARG